jgi:hypothetical protein
MKTTRVHSDRWIFDGVEYHRAAVDRSESEHGVRFHPRVDVRHVESQDCQRTYKLAPGAEDPGIPTLKEARHEAEKGRDEWERGRRTLYPMPEPEPPLDWPYRDMLKQEWDEVATRPRNEALEKRGGAIESEIFERLWGRDVERAETEATKEHSEPDMDLDR